MTNRIVPTVRARQSVDIGGVFTAADESLPARTFGVLADLAFPIVEHYRSDLWHDARWLRTYVAGPMTFYYGVDDWGTSIGTDATTLDNGRRNLWRIDVETKRTDAAGDRYWSSAVDDDGDVDASPYKSWRVTVAPVRLDVERAA